ncbi:unnamed protein product [Mytilus edulis]|uniref:Uncharacterized protein n=1 Tax=Mytilus edulis TaxID=6550 RepID=A0A8S3TNW8_MYTED|nr:unnamed protein product [Mytilus edulis]
MSFQNLNQLLLFDLSRNKLQYLESDAFFGLKQLKELILQNNTLIYHKAFPLEVLKPLKSLTHLNIKVEYDYVFESFPDDVISFVTSLQEIEIDMPYPYPFGPGLKKLTKLRKLEAGFCSLMALGDYVFQYMKYLEYIDLSTCHITYYRSTFSNRKPLHYLELGNPTFYENYVEALVKDLETTSIKTLIMTNLFYNISTFPTVIFRSLNNTNIREISMKSNRLRKAIGNAVADSLPSTLETLDRSNNEIKEIKFGMSRLFFLNMRNNSLGDYLVNHSYTTSANMQLKGIDLSQNSIFELNYALFNGHMNLHRNNLSKNFLQELSLDLSDQSNLMELDLSNNFIKRFNDKTINYINEILKKFDLKINLLNNTFECSCLTYSTLTLISENIHHFLHSENYQCQNDDGTIIALNNIKEKVDQLTKACTSHTILIICIVECIPHLEEEGNFRLCLHQRDFIPGEEIAANITNAVHENGHRFQQDNDPKHRSKLAKSFMIDNGIQWWDCWPSESPDINPIEMTALQEFWTRDLTIEYCNRFIDHLYKVVPVVIALEGRATADVPRKIFPERSYGKSISYFKTKLDDPSFTKKIEHLLPH